MSRLTPEQVERYSRHILLPGVGGKGQRRLLESRVAVVGAGGLGSPAILYLAAAGVGTIDVIDSDRVELSNLQRQILHTTPRVGMPKVQSAATAVGESNPDVRLVGREARLDAENALELLGAADVVLDGSDNFETRYLVNDACRLLGKPLVSAAIQQFEGQVTVFSGRAGEPCYRCLFPEPPAPGAVPSCEQAGVFGVIAGTVGCLQATEALKLLLGLGEPLVGRLLLYDAREAQTRIIRFPWAKDCALCGEAPTIRSLQPIAPTGDCRHSAPSPPAG